MAKNAYLCKEQVSDKLKKLKSHSRSMVVWLMYLCDGVSVGMCNGCEDAWLCVMVYGGVYDGV